MTVEDFQIAQDLLVEVKKEEQRVAEFENLITLATPFREPIGIHISINNQSKYFECDDPDDFLALLNARKSAHEDILEAKQLEFDNL